MTGSSPSADPVGLLVMAYGTASGPDDIERYYTDIRGGRPPTAEHLEELRARYAAIGNRFPLLEMTRRQAAGLEAALNADGDGRFRSYLGMKHSPPFIAEGVEAMRRDGIERAVGLVMAPHWSGMSVETYVERVTDALGGTDTPAFTFVKQWYDHPAFVELLAARVAEALGRLPHDRREGAAVVFSAHSLPQRTVEDGSTRCLTCHLCPDGCRYQVQLDDTARLVGERLRLPACAVGWQSAGRTDHPWLGPPVEDVIRDLAGTGHSAVVVCSAGFVADHLEILYDLDIEARAAAEEAGVAFARTDMPNDDAAFLRALAEVVRDHLAAPVGPVPSELP
ncbi:MAG TPA: ferrochelatase [Actinomycetota bacterium]|nr:ferrochelatase [Actinomycetota bacterium]